MVRRRVGPPGRFRRMTPKRPGIAARLELGVLRSVLALPPLRAAAARRASGRPGRAGPGHGDPADAPAPAAGREARPLGRHGRADPPGHPRPDPAGRRASADRRHPGPRAARCRRPAARPALHAPCPGRRRGARAAAVLPPRRRHGVRRPRHARRDLPDARGAGRRPGPGGGLPARAGAPVPRRGRRLLGVAGVGRRARRHARRRPAPDRRGRRLGRRDPGGGLRDQGRRGRCGPAASSC